MSIENIKASIRNVPDFPKKGIQFKDITTAVKKTEVLQEILEVMATQFANSKIDYVIGIESRGFIFGAALAYLLKCGFVPVRKSGKLPAKVISEEYSLEYGTDKLEIHEDALEKGTRVLIVDDLLATGGTAEAVAKLVKKCEADIISFAFVVELKDLSGREKLAKYADVYSVVEY